uniref:DUF7041 domain-containing protein n=1 Tax=Bombyx mori TaxID=7091 RepID=A0A8R2M6U0_BOMMO|nr:uncharacterized protein LOC119630234 [Bombyx mori]
MSVEKTIASGSSDLGRVGVRVPPFYPDKPALWFAQLETQFLLSSITADSTKFHYTCSQLDEAYASTVEDIITNPPASGKYERLKSELINRLSKSREKKVQQLLHHEELGDRKPSQFLRHLRDLAGADVPEDFVRTIWVSRLPSNTQAIVASQCNASLEDVSQLADKVHDVVSNSPQVAAVGVPESSAVNAQIAELTRQAEIKLLSSEPHTRFQVQDQI